MKILLLFLTLLSSSFALADCQKMLTEKHKKDSVTESLDPRITLQVVSAANRIAGESLWKSAPEAKKIEENLYKSDFSDKNQSLTVFYNKAAEVQGYIQVKNKKTSYWCMK